MKGQLCSIITPSLGFDTSPEVTKASYNPPPFRLCLRSKKTKPVGHAETITAGPPLAPPTTKFVTSLTTQVTPVLKDIETSVVVTSAVPSLSSSCSTTSTSTTTIAALETSISRPLATATAPPSEENRGSHDICYSFSDFSDTLDSAELSAEYSTDSNRHAFLSTDALQKRFKYALFKDDKDDHDAPSDTQPTESQQNKTILLPTNDNVETVQNFLTFHSKSLIHHQPFSKSKDCLNEKRESYKHENKMKNNFETDKSWKQTSGFCNDCSVNNISVLSETSIQNSVSDQSIHPFSYETCRCSNRLAGKWIIKRDFHSKYLQSSGYGERNNVWTRNNKHYQAKSPESTAELRDSLKEGLKPLHSEGRNVNTRSSVDTMKTPTSFEKDTPSLFSASLKCLISQSSDSKTSSLTTAPTTLSPVWLAQKLRKLHKIRHDEFQKKRFPKNNLSSQEFYFDVPICKKVLIQKSNAVSLGNEERRRTISKCSASSQETFNPPSQCDLSKAPKVFNLSQSPYTSTTIFSSPSSCDVCGTALKTEPKLSLSRSVAFSSSSLSGKSLKSTRLTKDVQGTTPSCTESKTVNMDTYNGLSSHSTNSEKVKKEAAQSNLPLLENTTEKQCQEMIDYFWSYQGMSRQVLGMRSPYFSLQSLTWEREKMAAGKTDDKLLRDQYQDLQRESVFSNHSRLPPILVTDYDDLTATTSSEKQSFSSSRLDLEPKQNAPQDKHAQCHDKRERKKRYKKHKAKATSGRNVLADSKDNQLEPSETQGKDKLRLVVKLPLIQKSPDEE